MNREEFITLCRRCGYCSKAQAERYAGDRDEFTDDDFIEAHRFGQREVERRALGKWHVICGGKSTKGGLGGDPSNR